MSGARVGILGSGSFGTSLAVVLAAAGREVCLWGRRDDFVAEIERERENKLYLPGVEIPTTVRLTTDLAAVAATDVILVAVPSHGFRAVVRAVLDVIPAGHRPAVVSATKGIERESLARMSEVIVEESERAGHPVDAGTLAGPTFAIELANGSPTAAVVAAHTESVADYLREVLACPTFRLYSSTDVIGVELGGTTKNVIAIAAGVVHGLGLGHNTLAALLTRGLHEITRLSLACGGRERTVAGLAGMGDLVLTCTGGPSRNRRFGIQLAAGKSVEEIAGATPMVAEGVRNSLVVATLAERHHVEMPITEQMVDVLHHDKPAHVAVKTLMARERKQEHEL